MGNVSQSRAQPEFNSSHFVEIIHSILPVNYLNYLNFTFTVILYGNQAQLSDFSAVITLIYYWTITKKFDSRNLGKKQYLGNAIREFLNIAFFPNSFDTFYESSHTT